jgi:hypothetical protein
MGTSFPGIIPIPIVEIFRSFLYVQVTPESSYYIKIPNKWIDNLIGSVVSECIAE